MLYADWLELCCYLSTNYQVRDIRLYLRLYICQSLLLKGVVGSLMLRPHGLLYLQISRTDWILISQMKQLNLATVVLV